MYPLTFSSCDSEITGPTSTPFSHPGPTFIFGTMSLIRSTKASWMLASTRTRVPAMQICPAL